MTFVNRVRTAELAAVVSLFPPSGDVLEIGAGTGQQARDLSELGYRVVAIDRAGSSGDFQRIFPVKDVDGPELPFPDQSFDVVFSSNVVEHLTSPEVTFAEMKRVLRKGGYCIHAVPTHASKLWTIIMTCPCLAVTFIPDAWKRGLWRAIRRAVGLTLQPRHGERGTSLGELVLFHPSSWRRYFVENGFDVVESRPLGLLYTMHSVFEERISIEMRRRLAGWLGSSVYAFKLVPRAVPSPSAVTSSRTPTRAGTGKPN